MSSQKAPESLTYIDTLKGYIVRGIVQNQRG